jgi:hypothetical protein
MKPLYQYMLLFFSLIIMAMVVSGCGIADRYTYSNIYAEYAGPALFDYSDPLIYQEKTDDEGTDVSTFTLEKPLSIDKVISYPWKTTPT